MKMIVTGKQISGPLLSVATRLSCLLRAALVVCLCLPLAGLEAQFLPKPRVLPSDSVSTVQVALRSAFSGPARLPLLLQLATHFTYKNLQSAGDRAVAQDLLQEALSLANKSNNRPALGQALLMQANLLALEEHYDEAIRMGQLADDTTRARIWIALAYRYLNGREPSINQERAGEMLSRAAMLTDSLANPDIYIALRRCMAERLIVNQDFQGAKALLSRALVFGKRENFRALQGVYLTQGYIGLLEGSFDAALQHSLQALDCIRATADSASAGAVYSMLADIFWRNGQHDKSIEHNDLALHFLEQYGADFGDIWICLTNNAAVMINKHRYQEALNYYQAMAIRFPPQSAQDQSMLTNGLGDCYLKLKKYDQAEKYFLQDFHASLAAGSRDEHAYHRIAFFYVESGQYHRALPYLDSAEAMVSGASMQAKAHLYYMYFLADSALGNLSGAIHYLQRNRAYNDTVYQENKVRETQRYATQYETARQQEKIQLLQKSNELHAFRQRHAEWIRNISIIAGLIASTGIMVFYRQNRNNLRMAGEINQKNRQLEILLREKEWLLKEVHHRVKNNLQSVVNLLEIQAEFLEDDALQAIENSQHRIHAMSLIHQKLYADDHPDAIDLHVYIGELCAYLRESLGRGEGIGMELSLHPVTVDLALAVPLGLIINEAVSNAYKHAFPENKPGRTIIIALAREAQGLVLSITDNGIGLSADRIDRPAALGVKLIRGLCRQIDADLDLLSGIGTTVRVKVPLDPVAPALTDA